MESRRQHMHRLSYPEYMEVDIPYGNQAAALPTPAAPPEQSWGWNYKTFNPDCVDPRLRGTLEQGTFQTLAHHEPPASTAPVPPCQPSEAEPNADQAARQVDFQSQWVNRKEARWDIVGPSRRNGKEVQDVEPSPEAQGVPELWAENVYDAQDVLPYFSVSQTILTTKVPRVVARCVLLTRSLHDVKSNWRSGTIQFTMRVPGHISHYLSAYTFVANYDTSISFQDPKDATPLQFRKLISCNQAGLPVRLLAMGDFPTLPTVPNKPRHLGPEPYELGSRNWQKGVVVLGFFWVTRVEEVEYSSGEFDYETGKCSGRAKWAFEFKACWDDNPPWWCPAETSNSVLEEPEHAQASKRRRVSEMVNQPYPKPFDEIAKYGRMELDINEERIYPRFGFQPASHKSLGKEPIRATSTPLAGDKIDIDLPEPTQYPSIPLKPLEDPPSMDLIMPSELGMSLVPFGWGDEQAIRPPQLRASLLLGWHCATCGKLNSRVKWAHDQKCPLCETIVKFAQPEWHRKAHTEAVGPIGTFYRLDDGGHQPKTGLHQMAARDLENGLTCVEYWLAEPPMPILAELNRDPSTSRRVGARPKKPPVKKAEKDSRVSILPLTHTSSTPGPGHSHPPGNTPKKARDAAGSRAVFSKDTRMLFMHITCPQHHTLLDPVDAIFSAFATEVPMERQVNSSSYRTGESHCSSTLSSHYTYLAGVGTHAMHTSPAVDWDSVPNCIYDAHCLLVDRQSYSVSADPNHPEVCEFNQSVFVVGNGANGTSIFRTVHKAEEGPVGYMVFGASCYIEIIVGKGDNQRRTTKEGSARRAEMLLAHGDVLLTSTPLPGDPPLEVRVKRTGLAVVSIARYIPPESRGASQSSLSAIPPGSTQTKKKPRRGTKRKI